MSKKRVLHLINGEFYSGAERVQDLLGLRLPELGYECGFACLKPGKFPECRVSQSSPLYAVPMRSRFDLSPVKTLARLIEQEGYQILHTHTPRAALIGRFAAARAGVPMVHHVHSPTRRDTESRVRNLLNTAIENLSLSRVSRLVAVSHSLQGYLRECGFADNRIGVVPNGVPVVRQASDWQAPSGEWVIGMVALFRPRKGLEVLLQAMALLRAAGQPVRLRAVGGFETSAYQQEILQLSRSLQLDGAIDWVGFTTDVPAEFAHMDAFVLPSLFGEGLPMVVLEAMASGVPVISTEVEGIPEVLGQNEAGIVVAPNDPQALAQGLQSLMAMGAQAVRIAHAGFERQRDHYSDLAMARGVARIYDEVLQ